MIALFLMQTEKRTDAGSTLDLCSGQTRLESTSRLSTTSYTLFADYYSAAATRRTHIAKSRNSEGTESPSENQFLVQVVEMNQGQCISVVKQLIQVLSESLFRLLGTSLSYFSTFSKITDTRLLQEN